VFSVFSAAVEKETKVRTNLETGLDFHFANKVLGRVLMPEEIDYSKEHLSGLAPQGNKYSWRRLDLSSVQVNCGALSLSYIYV